MNKPNIETPDDIVIEIDSLLKEKRLLNRLRLNALMWIDNIDKDRDKVDARLKQIGVSGRGCQ